MLSKFQLNYLFVMDTQVLFDEDSVLHDVKLGLEGALATVEAARCVGDIIVL